MIRQAPLHIRDNHRVSLYTYAKIIETWASMGYCSLTKVAEMLDTSPELCGKAANRYLNKGVKKTTILKSRI